MANYLVTWSVQKSPSGFTGTISIPSALLAYQASAATPPAALKRATALSLAALKSPVVQAFLPPQAQLALKLLPKLAAMRKLF